MKKFAWVLSLLFLVHLSACTAPRAGDPAVTLNVLAAASLSDAFQEMAPAFETAHPGFIVQFNFAGSQQLAQQLASGAPADIFASANQKQMEVAVEAGRVEQDAAVPFVQNRLVVVVPSANPAGIASLKDLAKPGLKLVFAAKEVPVGQYTLDFLTKADMDASLSDGFAAKVLANVVSYEENVKAVLAKVSLGEADAGIVYTSDAASADGKVTQIAIPDTLNILADYPIAVIEDSPLPELAAAFIQWVQSDQGQTVLKKYGFLPIKNQP